MSFNLFWEQFVKRIFCKNSVNSTDDELFNNFNNYRFHLFYDCRNIFVDNLVGTVIQFLVVTEDVIELKMWFSNVHIN